VSEPSFVVVVELAAAVFVEIHAVVDDATVLLPTADDETADEEETMVEDPVDV
jgi:hypothetical protein